MKRALLIAVAAMAFSGMPAVAGGSGSSSSAPSESGPSYDPVEEYQKGIDALKAGEYSKAERAFKRVAKVAKKDANTRYMLGLAHYGQDEFGAAAKSFARAVKYDDKLYAAYAKLGVSYLKTDKTEKADAVLGDLTVAADACAATCAEAGEIAAAIAEINAAKAPVGATDVSDLEPLYTPASLASGDLLYSDAVRRINLGEYDEAIAQLRAASTILGPHPDVLTYIGFANRKKNEKAAALAYYTAALEIAPDHLSANEYLGEYYVELGDLERAQAQLDKLNALCPFGCAQSDELERWIADAQT